MDDDRLAPLSLACDASRHEVYGTGAVPGTKENSLHYTVWYLPGISISIVGTLTESTVRTTGYMNTDSM